MMKSFFKKLAFVMALAMIVTAAAPAAKAAVAAEDKALAIAYQNGSAVSEINLTEVGDEEDLRFLYAPANWKELGFKFTSSNENVVTVDPVTGVVKAVAAGSAIVSVAVGTETASVTVNCVDLPTYTVKISDPEGNLVTEYTLDEVGATVDFAFKGVKDYSRDDYTGTGVSRYFCQWDTTDETVAKVNQSGLVEAVAPGKAKITLIVWNLETGKKHDVDACWVTIPEVVVEEPEVEEQNIIPVFNKTQDVVEVLLGSGAGLTKDNVKVFRVFTADDDYTGDGNLDDFGADKGYESVYVEKVTFNSATGNWDVQTFDDFIDGATYEVVVPKYNPERFTASVGDVAYIEVFEVGTGAVLPSGYDLPAVPTQVDAILKDKNGVDVTTRVVNGVRNDDPSNLVFWLTETSNNYTMTGYDTVEFYEMDKAYAMATFDNNGNPVDSAVPCELVPAPVEEYGIKRVVSWTLVKYVRDGSGNITGVEEFSWTNPVTNVPAGEYDYVIATLLEDTRGNYFTTCEWTTTAKAPKNVKYGNNTVYYTEDPLEPFWIYGYRVEYRAMDPDKMLVETYGDIASYEEGKARYALYLYNQFETVEREFIKELYSQYVIVCHPMKMTDMKATAAVTVFMNTEHDDLRDGRVGIVNAENAYYSIWSKSSFEVKLLDIHSTSAKEVLAKGAHAEEAVFTVELVSPAITGEGTLYDDLKTLVATWETALNAADANKATIDIEANDFAALYAKRSQIKIKITEAITGKTQYVNITLKRPELDANGSAVVGTINEYNDLLGVIVPYEKYVLSNKSLNVAQHDYKAADYNLVLLQPDKSGNYIGVENNLYISTVLDPKQAGELINATGAAVANDDTELKAGDRVIIVKGPDAKIYADITEDYKNPLAMKAPVGFELPTKAVGFGVTIANATKVDGKDVTGGVTAADGTTTFNPLQYVFSFAAAGADGAYAGEEIVFAKTGRYTATIKTVDSVAADGKVTFTQSAGLTSTVYINVTNDNAQATMTNRNFTRVTDTEVALYTLAGNSIGSYDWDGSFDHGKITVNAEYGDEADVKALILAAFKFNVPNDNALTVDDILYYTYTYTGSNKQVVINSVTFKVPAKGNAGLWYRSTATVNKSLTFELE